MLTKIQRLLSFLPLVLLAGCKMDVMNPSGDVAMQERDLIVISTLLLLLIIVPVIVMIFVFAWRYRHTNTDATYDPEWHHSTRLEVMIWAAPLAIIVALGGITWVSSHLLDPYRSVGRTDPQHLVTAETKAIRVDVVALDWKWLFIYPDQGFAVVNELAAPVGVPVDFRITASSVMNSFWIPSLAGQIYAMPGMVTQLHAVINHPGVYEGMSSNYSGAGFSDMHFKFHGMSQTDFDAWVVAQRAPEAAGSKTPATLGREQYLALEKPSIKNPVQRYPTVDAGLFDLILDQCVDPAKMCMSDMMHADAGGGLGLAAAYSVSHGAGHPAPGQGMGQTYVLALCTTGDPTGLTQRRQIR